MDATGGHIDLDLFAADACPVCGRSDHDGHSCHECVDELVRRELDWEVMGPDEMRDVLHDAPWIIQ